MKCLNHIFRSDELRSFFYYPTNLSVFVFPTSKRDAGEGSVGDVATANLKAPVSCVPDQGFYAELEIRGGTTTEVEQQRTD